MFRGQPPRPARRLAGLARRARCEDLQDRPWGLTDFRILDPAGYYLRITSRAG